MDLERALGVLISRWALLTKPCELMCPRTLVIPMKAFNIMDKIVIGVKSGHDSELLDRTKEDVKQEFIIDEFNDEKNFT